MADLKPTAKPTAKPAKAEPKELTLVELNELAKKGREALRAKESKK